MTTSCGYEFQLRHLRFESADESNFYEFQWWKNKLPYVIFRGFLFLYHWGWLIAGWVIIAEDHYYTISNWSVFLTGVYFLVAFISSLYGIIARRDYHGTKIDPALVLSKGVQPAAGKDEGKIWFLHKFTWLTHVAATTFVLYVTVLYWVAVAPGVEPYKLRKPIGQHKHSVQMFLVLLDFFLVAIPTRWMHFVYVMVLAFGYCIMIVIVHVTEVNSAVYSFLNFKTNVGMAVGVIIAAFLVAPVILQTIYFALYHLRAFIYRQTIGKEQVSPLKTNTEITHDNPAFVA